MEITTFYRLASNLCVLNEQAEYERRLATSTPTGGNTQYGYPIVPPPKSTQEYMDPL